MKLYANGLSDMTKMAATHICGNNPLKILSKMSGPIAMKLGM